MNRRYVVSAVVSLALILLPNTVAPAMASPFTGGTAGWTIIGQPTVSVLNGNPTAKVTYLNNLNVTIPLGLVLLVVHNSVGQTVYVNAGTTSSVAAGGNSTAFVVIYGVQSGSYTANIFAELPSGTAMSVATSFSVNI
jgi:hypothetical protein